MLLQIKKAEDLKVILFLETGLQTDATKIATVDIISAGIFI